MSPSFKIGIVNKLFKKLNEDSILHIFDNVKYKIGIVLKDLLLASYPKE